MASLFRDGSGDQEDLPFSKIDKDGDNVVGCTEFDQATYRASGGFPCYGRFDCDDNDAYVYPAAPAICDRTTIATMQATQIREPTNYWIHQKESMTTIMMVG